MTEIADFDEHAATTFDLSPVGQLVTTADGTIVRMNRMFAEWVSDIGKTGRRFQDLLTVGSRVYYETHVVPSLHMHGSVSEIALEIRHADGRRVHVLANAVGAPSTGGVIRWAVFVADARRSYEREVLAAKDRAESSEQRAVLLARVLQQTLVPATPPLIPGLDVAAAYRPAGDGTQIGGDFYDVFQIAVDDWMIVLGDVQGKGVEAAVVTALARYTVRAAAVEHDSPAAVLALLNTVLRLDDTERCCTAVAMRVRRMDTNWHVLLSCAGHPSPFLVRADGVVAEIGESGRLLGFFEDARLRDTWHQLGEGDVIVAFTDGASEARRGGQWFGEARIAELAAETRPDVHQTVASILDEVLQFQSGTARDDIAIVAFGASARGAAGAASTA